MSGVSEPLQNHLKELKLKERNDCFFQDERHGMNVTGRLQEMIPVQGDMMDEHKNNKSVSAAAESIESFQSLVSPSGPDSPIHEQKSLLMYKAAFIHWSFHLSLSSLFSRLRISAPEPSEIDLHCQSCVHIVDSDQWVQVKPSVCTDEGGSKFRISTQAGRFECSRTRMRWVCSGDVILQYRAVDGHFLSAELERLQCERIGPVIDVTVISGKLEEAHLPHYACLAESDPSLKDAVKVLSFENEGITLESVELTRFHARILQPDFSPKTVLMKLGIPVKVHCDLLIFMTKKNPIILHVYFFPSDSIFAKRIKTEEKLSHQIKCSRPETPLQMMKQHSLEVPGASVQPKEIKLRGDIEPNFFQVKQTLVDDINMTLSRVDDQKSVWTATIWKELTDIKPNKPESTWFQNVQKHKTTQVPANFDKAQFFDKNWCDLIKYVKNVNAIADKLLQRQIIQDEIYSEITHPNSTSEESMRRICSVVRKGSVTVKEILISVLLEENPNLLNHLPLSDS
ncbi:NACHT, LRR and PYD domains-containing protein 1 homolog [Megalobrama amblycephala]|uniref:NACHT, LRR and PYD domains-containing protein 1 homolog n=1 Tax=Megalobrama amblycephala TaxID=75352 RepID=UPI0020146ABF|nr:NACHT, LRR and PYD domains-containing protein 1 homolog [Megalobrama amblycephala]